VNCPGDALGCCQGSFLLSISSRRFVGGGGRFVGSGARFAHFHRGFGHRRFGFGFGFGSGFWPYYAYADDYGSCWRLRHVRTPYGWAWRRIYVCDYGY
jgi:hypothetical protein